MKTAPLSENQEHYSIQWQTIVLIFSIGALGFSLIYEFAFNYAPCQLCILQRIAHIVVILCYPFYHTKYHFFTKLMTQLALFGGLLIGTLHYFIQIGLIADFCAIPQVKSLKDFETLLSNNTACSQTKTSLLNIPLSAWNAIFCLVLLFSSLKTNLPKINFANPSHK